MTSAASHDSMSLYSKETKLCIPKAYIPPREVRDIRELLRYRASLVSVRVGINNKVHAVLTKNGMDCTFTDVLGRSSQLWLKNLNLRACYRQEIDGYLRIAEAHTESFDRRDHQDD